MHSVTEQIVQIAQAKEELFPSQLHTHIMKGIYRTILIRRLILMGLLISIPHSLFSGWQVVTRALETDAFTFFRIFFTEFEINREYISSLGSVFFDFMPVQSSVMLAIDLLIASALFIFFIKNKGRSRMILTNVLT